MARGHGPSHLLCFFYLTQLCALARPPTGQLACWPTSQLASCATRRQALALPLLLVEAEENPPTSVPPATKVSQHTAADAQKAHNASIGVFRLMLLPLLELHAAKHPEIQRGYRSHPVCPATEGQWPRLHFNRVSHLLLFHFVPVRKHLEPHADSLAIEEHPYTGHSRQMWMACKIQTGKGFVFTSLSVGEIRSMKLSCY